MDERGQHPRAVPYVTQTGAHARAFQFVRIKNNEKPETAPDSERSARPIPNEIYALIHLPAALQNVTVPPLCSPRQKHGRCPPKNNQWRGGGGREPLLLASTFAVVEPSPPTHFPKNPVSFPSISSTGLDPPSYLDQTRLD